MRLALLVAMGLLSFLTGCTGSKPREGGLYYTQQENGTYAVFKILKIDSNGVHVRLYSNRFSAPPTKIDESSLYMAGIHHKPDEAMGMGHIPVSNRSFATWHAVFFQQSTVKPDELDGYQYWLEDKGGYF